MRFKKGTKRASREDIQFIETGGICVEEVYSINLPLIIIFPLDFLVQILNLI